VIEHTWGSPTVDLNFAYRIGLETMQNIILQKEIGRNWVTFYNLEKLKQYVVNELSKNYTGNIWDPYVLSSNIEYQDNLPIYLIEGYVEAYIKKGFFGGWDYNKKFLFEVEINPEKNQFFNFKYYDKRN
jgi:hypothetical protein